ncbi:hypothetical protein [Corynebacterium auris]|uniref:hypothetical protein n=1 Tax=Corynebacterium auris TaxID=44750 RepID=UPI0025B4B411|nr:hypothetical protein [Corynebacterium auris]
MVPTLTMFGRFSIGTRPCGVAIPWLEIAVVTHVSIAFFYLEVISNTPVTTLTSRQQPALLALADSAQKFFQNAGNFFHALYDVHHRRSQQSPRKPFSGRLLTAAIPGRAARTGCFTPTVFL